MGAFTASSNGRLLSTLLKPEYKGQIAMTGDQERAHLHLSDAGAHYVIDNLGDLLPVVEELEERLARPYLQLPPGSL
jgi:hypothetical protein